MQAPEHDGSATSILRPIGYQSGSCGYCQDKHSSQRIPNTRANYYAATDSLDPSHYQALVDRGWRRSGTLLYKPDQWRSCCPHYTIRLPAAQLKASKDQRQAVNRWNRYVIGEDYAKEAARLHPKPKEREKNEGFNLLRTVHESERGRLREPPPPAHHFEVSLEPDDFTEEKFTLYANYQEHVHHDPPDKIVRSGFRRFLCDSPLRRRTRLLKPDSGAEAEGDPGEDRKEQKLGSYHQLYRLDGRLIALGVLDLLPHCVSGVYFLYHSDFEKWSFGKLSALREAALAVEGGYQWYYMGYYIHECVKMRYKGDYKPQMVLDPESYEWVSLDGEFRDALDQRKYTRKRKRVELGNEDAEREMNRTTEEKANRQDTNELEDEQAVQEGTRAENDLYTIPDSETAADTGLSLLELGMPGVMTAEEVESQIDLDRMKIKVRNRQVNTEDIISWGQGSIEDAQSIKGVVAEFAACVGPQLAGEVVLKFGR
ncbi:arginine-tRNA-protein transferase 1 [Viridothelium virens]|uniref:Arginyl-tRNA--protein transferase 1 n=1 Tax=Viridothelium virens TaxID=1048519 RepID=A0A6A6HG98_VIRVR|nr:arginine-tRNA-protein transferase 1 [Viridothelium virens]